MIRTAEDLSDKLAQDLAWRKKELSELLQLIRSAQQGRTRQRTLCRCGVAILYAHFEGFIRNGGRRYLELVCMKRLKNAELSDRILTLIVRNQLSGIADSHKASSFYELVTFLRHKAEARSRLPYKTAVDTESNLSSSVLKEIIWCLEFDFSPYESKQKLIDSKLLGRRNHIAHGEFIDVDSDEYEQLHREVVSLMSVFRNQAENAAVGEKYRMVQVVV